MKKWMKMTGMVSSTIALASGVFAPAVSAASQPQVVQLTYWNMWSGIWEKVVMNMVNDFNKTHPDIHVNVLSVPSNSAGQSEQKLLTAIAAGDPPDVFTEWSPYVAAFAQKGALMNLQQFMVGPYAGLKHWFYPVAAKWGTYKGKMYAMPWTMNSFELYYNKDIMKASGLNPNKPPTTIAQLDADSAKEYKAVNGQVRQIGFYPNWYDVWMASFGISDKTLFNHGKYTLVNRNALNLMNWISTYKKYPFSQVSAFFNAVGGSNGGTDPFIVGKEGFIISGMWEMPSLQQFNPKLNYGVVPLPIVPSGYQDTTWVNGNYNEIPSGSKHPKQAFEFISWLSGYNNAAWAAKNYPTGGWIPNSPYVTAQPAYRKWMNQLPLRKGFVSIMLNTHDAITPVTPIDMFYEQKLGDEVNYVLQGKKTPRQALADLQKQVTQELASSK